MLALAAVAFVAWATPAAALVLPPSSIEGPSNQGLSLGGVAMAPDGSGGLVYTKLADGVPHVFVSRYDGQRWGGPIRVDAGVPYDAGWPRIAAGEGGGLLVVWVTQTATVCRDGESPPCQAIQRGLYSASLGPGANDFGPPLLIDPDLGDGAGATPSLAGTESGKAIVAYRAIVEDFSCPGCTDKVQLRPGDVISEVRLARLTGDRWSRIGTINRDAAISSPAPSSANGPQVALGAAGGAVVAWQEREQSGTARIWWRRVFGTALGPTLEGSPRSWAGRAVSEDADAFSLDATAFEQARIATRVGDRIFLNTLPPNFLETAAKPTGPEAVDAGTGPGSEGAPSIAASDEGGSGQGSLRLAFAAGDSIRQLEMDVHSKLSEVPMPGAPAPTAGGEVVVAVDPAGGGLAAWPTLDPRRRPVVAVRQEFAGGMAQTGLLSGARATPISQLSIGRSGTGEALIAFRQGDSGLFELVATRISLPPVKFPLEAPERWVRPRLAKVRWGAPPSAVGGISYGVVLDGRSVKRNLQRRSFRPAPGLLGSGAHSVQILATDRLGQQLLSPATKLKVDARPPRLEVKLRSRRVVLRLMDSQSGLFGRATRCRFGDGTSRRGGGACRHRYVHPGRYAILVRARDRARNRLVRRLWIKVHPF